MEHSRRLSLAVVNQFVFLRFTERVLDPTVKVSQSTEDVFLLQPFGDGLRHVVQSGEVNWRTIQPVYPASPHHSQRDSNHLS